MARLTTDQWLEARQRWEADPTLTFEALADTLKISRQAVSKKARADDWAKVGALSKVRERAQFKADAKGAQVAQVAGATTKRDGSATFEASVEIRADVIDRHRSDWAEHRKHFALETIKKNFEDGKKAKISAEMLMIRQKGERAAYGLEEAGMPPSSRPDLLKEIAALLPP